MSGAVRAQWRHCGGGAPDARYRAAPGRPPGPRPPAPRPGRRRRAAAAPPAAGARAPRAAAIASRSTSTFQPGRDGLDPLGRVAHRHARHAGEVGLLLHPARVGEDRAGVAEQRGELEVAQRRLRAARPARPRARRASPPPPGARGSAGAAAAPRARAAARSRSTRRSQARGVVDVAGAVRGHEHVPARLDPGALERRRVGQRARLEEQRDVDHHVPDELDPPGRRARARGSRPPSRDGHRSRSERWSVRTRLSSSGIARSNERMPASTCATGMPRLRRRRARRRASSSCRRRRARRPARSVASSGPSAASMRAVCSVFVPPWIPSSRSGRGTPSSSTNTVLSSSSWCWPVWTSSSSCSARSARETAAALTNCGRFPMTVTTRKARSPAKRGALSACRAELLRDLRAHPLVRVARQRAADGHRAAVDRVDRQHLANRRGEERLLDAGELVDRDRPLGDVAHLSSAPARDRVEDVVVERRRHERAAVERAEERGGRRLEDAAVRRDEQRLVGALGLGEARREHVRRRTRAT